MKNAMLICPHCGNPLLREERRLVCRNNHCFDVARQGYVNLLPVNHKHSKNPGDTRDMVAARRAFLDRGHYCPIAEKVSELFSGVLPTNPAVLDAGCGEGYYLTELMKSLGVGDYIGVDISKDAVRFAAGRNKEALWLTASAAHLPVKDGTLDGIMSMFALTMPEEFHRVLKPGGYFLEVTAGRGHLMGLKNLIYSEIIEKGDKGSRELPGFRLVKSEVLEFPLSLETNDEIRQLLSMTPHFWRITREGAKRAEEAQSLRDKTQVEFHLYQMIEKSLAL